MSVVYLLMGVSGSGKTTIGRTLAGRLDAPFFDGDDFHPPENVAKMAAGIPLNDQDRQPWLIRLRELIHGQLRQGETAVIACSALKKQYRDLLREGNDNLQIVYLQGSYDLIRRRMEARDDHYMKPDMLKSQFAALEEPSPANTAIISIDNNVVAIVEEILRYTDAHN